VAKKVLLIHGEVRTAAIYRSRLQSQSYEVFFVADGLNGYHAIYEFKPDAILIDLSIPKMDAISIIRKLRTQKQFQNIAIFALGERSLSGNAEQALQVGASRYFDISEKQTLEEIIEALRKAFLTLPTLPKVERPAIRVQEHLVNPPGYQPLKALIDEFGSPIFSLRKTFLSFSIEKTPDARQELVAELLKHVKRLRLSESELEGLSMLYRPLEGLVAYLAENCRRCNPGIIQCIANAVDLIAALQNYSKLLLGLNDLYPVALVVDDEPVARRAITFGLEKGKVTVTAVDGPGLALEAARENNFDLIFLDVMMPGTNGLVLCSRIRELPNHKETPIIFITALSDEGTRSSSKISGANHFLIKPANMHELAVTAWTYLFRRCLKRQTNSPQPTGTQWLDHSPR